MHDLFHLKFTIYFVSRMGTTMKNVEVQYCGTRMGVQYQKKLNVIARSTSVNFMAYVCSFDSKINKFQYEFTCLPHSCIEN